MSEQPRPNPSGRPRHGLSDEGVDRIIGGLLLIGVTVSALVVSIGGILYLAREGRGPKPDYHDFKEAPAEPAGIVEKAVALDSRGLILFGLLLLIATPVARVIFSVAAFARQRDRLYVAFTLLVLAVLLYSLLGGYFRDRGGP